MNDVIPILNDIVLEAQTTARDLEYDDPVINNLHFIEETTKRVIEKLGEDTCV